MSSVLLQRAKKCAIITAEDTGLSEVRKTENGKNVAMRLTLLLFIAFPAQMLITFAVGLIPESAGLSLSVRNLIIPQILYPLLFEIPYLLIVKKTVPNAERISLAKPRFFRTVSAAFSFMFASVVTSFLFTELIRAVGFIKPLKATSFTANNGFEAALWIIAMAVLPPILEEAVFRGAILGTMKKYMGRGAIFFSAFLFALMHANFNQIPVAFVMGLILGWFAYETGSLIVPVVLHLCNNMFSVGFGMLGNILSEEAFSKADFYTTVSVCAVGSCCAIYETVVFIKKSKTFPHAEKGSVKGIFLSPAPMVYAVVMLALALLVNFSRI